MSNYSLQQAKEFIRDNPDKAEWLCHFLHEEALDWGISQPMSLEEYSQGGYIATYYPVSVVANESNWS